MSRQVNKNILELSTLLDNVLKVLQIRKQVDFALECKINPGTLSKALERGSLSQDIIDKIHDRYGVREGYWSDGKEPIIEKNSTYVEIPSDNKQKQQMEQDQFFSTFKNVVEGTTEYLLVPRGVLKDNYRLISLEQYEKDMEQLKKDREQIEMYKSEFDSKNKQIAVLLAANKDLTTFNNELLEKLFTQPAQSFGTQKSNQNPGVSQ